MMRHITKAVLVVVSSAMLAAQSNSMYDCSSEKVYVGTIRALATFPAADGSVGVHFDLKTPDGAIASVHVGPAMYIGMQNSWFFADDQVTIVGSRLTRDENISILAKSVQKGSDTLVLRSADGSPKWTGDDGIDGCGVNHLPIARGTER